MMIDQKYQSLGYGKVALGEVIKYIHTFPFGKSSRIILTCHKENKNAFNLYQILGFVEDGNADEDEIELCLAIK